MSEPKPIMVDRYVPRAIGKGPQWDVWDRKFARFIPDIRKIDVDERLPLSECKDVS